MDPRFQARLVEVRRQSVRRRHRWLAVAGGLAFVVTALVGATRTPVLAVRYVRLTGAVQTTRASVLAATGLSRHPLMVDVNGGRLGKQLAALPWVAGARVSRQWPMTVAIRLTERTPVASLAGAGGATALVDSSGRVLTLGAPVGGAPPDLPTITGLPAAGPPGTSVSASPGARDALLAAAALPGALTPGASAPPAPAPPALGAPASRTPLRGPVPSALAPGAPIQVRAIVVTGTTLRLTLSRGPSVLLGTADQLDQKLVALRTILQQVDLRGVATIDLRVPEVPVLTRST